MDRDGQTGANVRTFRESLGMSQAQVAEALTAAGVEGMYPQTVLKIEKGQRSLKLHEGVALARVLKVPVELITGDGSDLAALLEIRSALAATRAAQRQLDRAAMEFDDAVRRLRTAVGDPDPWSDLASHSPWHKNGEEAAVDVGYIDETEDAPARLARANLPADEKAVVHAYLNRSAGDVIHLYENPGF